MSWVSWVSVKPGASTAAVRSSRRRPGERSGEEVLRLRDEARAATMRLVVRKRVSRSARVMSWLACQGYWRLSLVSLTVEGGQDRYVPC